MTRPRLAIYRPIDVHAKASFKGATILGRYLGTTRAAKNRKEAREIFAAKPGSNYAASDLLAHYATK